MAEHVELEKHRQTINEKLEVLSKQIEDTVAFRQALVEFTGSVLSMVEILENRLNFQKAESLVFQKLILATPRLSSDFEAFKEKCRELEEQLGYYSKK